MLEARYITTYEKYASLAVFDTLLVTFIYREILPCTPVFPVFWKVYPRQIYAR